MTFNGFPLPTSNFFSMPNTWTDITANIDSLAELKVIEYVLRHTWGFQEFGKPKPISVDEFMHGRKRGDGSRIDKGTGLAESSVKDGLKRAIKHGYLICEVDDSDKARVKKSYALHMNSASEGGRNSAPRGVDTNPHRGRNSAPRGVDTAPRSEKETIERNSKKETIERKNGTPNISAKQEATHSSIHSSPSPSQKSSFSSQGKQEEEVSLSEEEQAIYDYACQTISKAKPPRKTAKLKGECAEIAKHVQTVEQFISLVHFVRALPYIQGQVHLKNLVNELNGWLQTRPGVVTPARQGSADDPIEKQRRAGVARSSYDDDDYVDDTFYGPKVTDAEITEKIADFCARYNDASIEENQRKAIDLQRELGISREKLYDCLFDAQVSTDRKGRTMTVFFEQLKLIIEERKAQALAS